jgi:hypothetical protein
MIEAIQNAKDVLTPIVPTEINHFGRSGLPYVVLRQVDRWYGQADNRHNMQYDLIQVDVIARDAPDFAMDHLVCKALEEAGYKQARTNGDSEEAGGVMLHRISHDYQYDQEYEEV